MTAKEAGASLEGVGVALMVLPNQPHESPRGGGVGNAYEHLFFFPWFRFGSSLISRIIFVITPCSPKIPPVACKTTSANASARFRFRPPSPAIPPLFNARVLAPVPLLLPPQQTPSFSPVFVSLSAHFLFHCHSLLVFGSLFVFCFLEPMKMQIVLNVDVFVIKAPPPFCETRKNINHSTQ